MQGQPRHYTWWHTWLPPSFQGMDAWMTSQLKEAVIHKLYGSLMCLAYFFDMLSLGVCTTRDWQTTGPPVQKLNVCTVPTPSYLDMSCWMVRFCIMSRERWPARLCRSQYNSTNTSSREGLLQSEKNKQWNQGLARTRPACLLYRQIPEKNFFNRQKILWGFFNLDFFGVITIYFHTNHLLGHGLSVNCPFWHNELSNVVGIRIWSS